MALTGLDKKWRAVIPAAGASSRFGAADKLEADLGGRPLLVRTIESALGLGMEVTLMTSPARVERWRAELQRLGIRGCTALPGGDERRQTVRLALESMDPRPDFVFIHDGARPLLSRELGRAVMRAAEAHGAATAALPVTDTVVDRDAHGGLRWLDRSGLFRLQTPQAFEFQLLLAAHEAAGADGLAATDDAQLAARAGRTVVLVPGEETNIKVTRPEDARLVSLLWERGGLE